MSGDSYGDRRLRLRRRAQHPAASRRGYRVRTSVRSLGREADVREMLKTGGAEDLAALSFVEADLTSDAGARGRGGLRVRAARRLAVPDVATQERGRPHRARAGGRAAGPARPRATPGSGASSSPPPSRRSATARRRSGARSPRRTGPIRPTTSPPTCGRRRSPSGRPGTSSRAWAAASTRGHQPVGILGPALGIDISSSIELVVGLMNGAMPGMPKLSFGIVDVRDVADAHIRAMTNPAAKGERFLVIAGGPMTLAEVAAVLRTRMPDAAAKVPTRILPTRSCARSPSRFRGCASWFPSSARSRSRATRRRGGCRLEPALERGRDPRDRREPGAPAPPRRLNLLRAEKPPVGRGTTPPNCNNSARKGKKEGPYPEALDTALLLCPGRNAEPVRTEKYSSYSNGADAVRPE